ncbi:hypothetical protein HWV62_13483 [Athelia sp. TMB]|nr:hypothetical protein HWV62_13483 [Athelia sp. TMB]
MATTIDPRSGGPVFNTTGSRDKAKVMNINGNYVQGKPNRTSNFSRNRQRQIASSSAPADSSSGYDPDPQAGYGFPPREPQQLQLPAQDQQGYPRQAPPRYNNDAQPRASRTDPNGPYGRQSTPPADQRYPSTYQPPPAAYQARDTSQLTSLEQSHNRRPSPHPSYHRPSPAMNQAPPADQLGHPSNQPYSRPGPISSYDQSISAAPYQPLSTDQLSNSFSQSYGQQPDPPSSYIQPPNLISSPYDFQMPQNQAGARGLDQHNLSGSLFDFTSAPHRPQETQDIVPFDRASSRSQVQSSLTGFGPASYQPQRTEDLQRSSRGGRLAISNQPYVASPDQDPISSYQATPPPHNPQETPQRNVGSPGSPPVSRQWIMPNANTRSGTEQWTVGTLPSDMLLPSTIGQTLASFPTSQELTLSAIEKDLKLKLPVRPNPPEIFERAEEEYVRSILTKLASVKQFERNQSSYASQMSRRVPKLFPRLFVYQLARVLFNSKTDPRKIPFCDQQLRVWGKLDRSGYLEKENEIEDILVGFKLESEDEQSVKINVEAIREIDDIGNAVQAKLARRATGVITTNP